MNFCCQVSWVINLFPSSSFRRQQFFDIWRWKGTQGGPSLHKLFLFFFPIFFAIPLLVECVLPPIHMEHGSVFSPVSEKWKFLILFPLRIPTLETLQAPWPDTGSYKCSDDDMNPCRLPTYQLCKLHYLKCPVPQPDTEPPWSLQCQTTVWPPTPGWP